MKQRKPRKSKKSIVKRGVLIYDLALLPNGRTIANIYKEFKEKGIVVYNSAAAGNVGQRNSVSKPRVINNVRDIKFIDLNDKSEIENNN